MVVNSCVAAAVALFLSACGSIPGSPPVVVGPNPTPPAARPARFVLSGLWDLDAQGLIGSLPITSSFHLKGHAVVELTPIGPPFLRIDGESDFTITPLPGLEDEAAKSLSSGDVVFTVNGKKAGLTFPPAPVEPDANREMPKPPPPAAPLPVTKPPSCPPLACVGPTCKIPVFPTNK